LFVTRLASVAPPALGFKLTSYPALPGLGYVWPAGPPALAFPATLQNCATACAKKQKASETSEASETKANYAFCTLPLFKQLAQTRTRRCDPWTIARTERRFTFQRRFVTLWAWLMLFPNCGPLPQTSHTRAILQTPDSADFKRSRAESLRISSGSQLAEGGQRSRRVRTVGPKLDCNEPSKITQFVENVDKSRTDRLCVHPGASCAARASVTVLLPILDIPHIGCGSCFSNGTLLL